jgi:hypothetical protein
MSPLKDLDKKKHQKDPNFLNCNRKEPMEKLDTARYQENLEISSTAFHTRTRNYPRNMPE